MSFPILRIHGFSPLTGIALMIAIAWAAWAACAVASTDGYQMPPAAIAELADAPTTPFVTIGPDPNWMVLIMRPGLPAIEEVAQPELRVAGLRINPRTNGPSRGRTYEALVFRRISDGLERAVTGLPEDPRISNIAWSPDGQLFAFTTTKDDRLDLWVAELKDGKARKISKTPLNAAYGRPYDWLSDNQTLIALTIPKDRQAAPDEPRVPSGPVIQENLGRIAPARTYQDLLENAYDEAVFEYYTTSQLVKMTTSGKHKEIGKPGIIRAIEPSPDGEHLLVTTVHRPFSYSLPQHRFPHRVEVWDLKGRILYDVVDNPLQDQIPVSFGSVATGRREIAWRADAAATLYWAEALDGGDGGTEAEVRDRVYLLPAPFDGEPQEIITLSTRFGDVTWGTDDLAIVSEWWWKTRNRKTWWIHPRDLAIAPKLLEDRSWEDRYNDPGEPMMKRTPQGRRVMITVNDGRSVFLSGDGASPEGNRPFVDEYDLETGEARRLWRSEAPYFENPVRMLDIEQRILVTRRESITDPPNYFRRDLKTGALDQKTFFPDPTPGLAGISKELIHYERKDGVKLTGTLYLPAGYDAERDGSLPMVMWAYPDEFKSAAAAGQVTDSPHRFTRVGWWSPMLFLVHGYAVLDNPSMPIVGEGDEEPNDTYVEQQVACAQAAIDEVVRRGVADRDRIAIGGHSYGAFMTANLLAHSDLFRLGLARSGAYNRTLTPFGFQSEERTFWEAPDVYFRMSPFMHTEKINEPILLVHGEADSNSGTYPLQSERFYAALKGNGATVRLVMLPHESHSYRARESIMHMLWETTIWLDRYVKNAPPRQEPSW